MKDDKSKDLQSAKRDIEKFMKKISEQNFESEEEMQAFLNNTIGKKYEEVFPEENKNWEDMSPQEQALDLVDQAQSAQSRDEIIKLAEKAIKIDSDCSEAYQLLGDYKATDAASATPWYKKAMEAARRTIGEENFEEYRGHFWGFHETRPYMRAKQSYAETLVYADKDEEAATQYKEILELNPNDNQGVRYTYGSNLISLGRFEDYEALLEMFPDEAGASWLFNKALYTFLKKGASQASVSALLKAHESNENVLPILSGKVDMSPMTPSYYSPGDENEAQYYVRENAKAWMKFPKALQFSAAVYGDGLKRRRIRSRNRKVKTKRRR